MNELMSDAVLSTWLFGLVIFFFTVGSVIITSAKNNKPAMIFAIIASLFFVDIIYHCFWRIHSVHSQDYEVIIWKMIFWHLCYWFQSFLQEEDLYA